MVRRLTPLALAATILAVARCREGDQPKEAVPEALQRDLPRDQGSAISELCASGGFSARARARLKREGRRELKALKRAYRLYPEHGVTITYDTEDNPAPRTKVVTVSELVDRELDLVEAAEGIDDRPASEVLSSCEKRAVGELRALKPD